MIYLSAVWIILSESFGIKQAYKVPSEYGRFIVT